MITLAIEVVDMSKRARNTTDAVEAAWSWSSSMPCCQRCFFIHRSPPPTPPAPPRSTGQGTSPWHTSTIYEQEKLNSFGSLSTAPNQALPQPLHRRYQIRKKQDMSFEKSMASLMDRCWVLGIARKGKCSLGTLSLTLEHGDTGVNGRV